MCAHASRVKELARHFEKRNACLHLSGHSNFQIALCHFIFSCHTWWVPNGYHGIFKKKIVDFCAM